MKKPELLAPGGSLEKLKTAIDYGADAVYIGGEMFSLRVAAENFSKEDMQEGIKYAHDRGKKVYLTANILPHNDDIEEFEEFVKDIKNYGFDAVLVADLGLFDMIQELAPEIPIHVSTQANNINYRSAIKWYKMGATRVVLAREMSFKEIAEFQKKIPEDLELEAFIHGAMCISYSGRCLAHIRADGITNLSRKQDRVNIWTCLKTKEVRLYLIQRTCVQSVIYLSLCKAVLRALKSRAE